MEYTNLYHSSIVNTTEEVDALIEKLLNYHPEAYACTVLGKETPIDLKTYFLSLVRIPYGNFLVYQYTNAPSGVTTTPLQLSIVEMPYQGVSSSYQIITDRTKIYIRDCTSSTAEWIDVSDQTSAGINLVAIHRGETEPTEKTGMWVKPSGELSAFSEQTQSWVSPVIDDMLLMPIYNPNRITQSPEEYIDEKTGYDQFIQHKRNELTLIHVTEDERHYFNNVILSKEDFATVVSTVTERMVREITDKYNEVTGYASNESTTNETKELYDSHIAVHLDETDFEKWDAKASSDHDHMDTSLHRVKISGEDIIAGIIPPSKLPDDIKERVYVIDEMDELATAEAAALQTSKYHTGNKIVYRNHSLEPTDYIWYRIADQTKIGTANYMEGLHKFRASVKDVINFSDIVATPITLKGYGITDGISSTAFDEILNSEYSVSAEKSTCESLNRYGAITTSNSVVGSALIAYIGFQEKMEGNTTYPMLNDSMVDILILTDANVLYRSRVKEGLSGFTEFSNMGNFTEEEFLAMFPVADSDIYTNTDNPNWETYRLGAGFKISRGQLTIARYIDFYPNGQHIQIGLRVTPTTMLIEAPKIRIIESLNNSLVHTNDYISLVKRCETISFDDILYEIYGDDQ